MSTTETDWTIITRNSNPGLYPMRHEPIASVELVLQRDDMRAEVFIDEDGATVTFKHARKAHAVAEAARLVAVTYDMVGDFEADAERKPGEEFPLDIHVDARELAHGVIGMSGDAVAVLSGFFGVAVA